MIDLIVMIPVEPFLQRKQNGRVMSSSFNVISKEISQLRNEKNQLQKDEQVLRKLIAKVKEQTNALQVGLKAN